MPPRPPSEVYAYVGTYRHKNTDYDDDDDDGDGGDKRDNRGVLQVDCWAVYPGLHVQTAFSQTALMSRHCLSVVHDSVNSLLDAETHTRQTTSR